MCVSWEIISRNSLDFARKFSDKIAYLFDPALPEVPIPGMMEAQIQVPGLAMVILFRVLAHVALLSDPGKPGDTQNEFAQTWRRIAHRAAAAAQLHPFRSRFWTGCGKTRLSHYLSVLLINW